MVQNYISKIKIIRLKNFIKCIMADTKLKSSNYDWYFKFKYNFSFLLVMTKIQGKLYFKDIIENEY